MPKYDYKCSACAHLFETVQSMNDALLTTCPQCGGSIRRVISSAGIMFKGSGFYITDSKGSSTASPSPSSGADKN